MLANPLPRAGRSVWNITERDSRVRHYAWGDVYSGQKLHLKTTLVLTKNTLMGQWHDEIRKFAPGLRVAVYHGGTSGNVKAKMDRGALDLSAVDVLLCTWTTAMPRYLQKCVTFHRTIIDE
jgi:SNF2 family DNA or RNA helicase